MVVLAMVGSTLLLGATHSMLLQQKVGAIARAPEVKLGEPHRLQLPQPGDGSFARFSSTQVLRDEPISEVDDRKYAWPKYRKNSASKVCTIENSESQRMLYTGLCAHNVTWEGIFSRPRHTRDLCSGLLCAPVRSHQSQLPTIVWARGL